MRLRWIIASCVLLAAETAHAQGGGRQLLFESEPNGSCSAAQNLGTLTYSLAFQGRLGAGEIDFVRFASHPGVQVELDYRVQPSSSTTLTDPVLGVFDSGCNPLSGSGGVFRVPADGVIIAALTACCDSGFSGAHTQSGAYTLAINERGEPLGELRGRVIDAETGRPVRDPLSIQIIHCEGELTPCFSQNEQFIAGGDGRFRFTDAFPPAHLPLRSGLYLVRVNSADGRYLSATFHNVRVSPGSSFNLGELPLYRNALRLELVDDCGAFLPSGPVCKFRVRVTNTSGRRVRAALWSRVETTTETPHSRYDVGPTSSTGVVVRPSLSLAPGERRELQFRIPLPVPPQPGDLGLCVDLWAGREPLPQLLGVQSLELFCRGRRSTPVRNPVIPAS
jgi:hypothetical protein